MGDNQRAAALLTLDNFQGAQRLAETHLGIPKHLVANVKACQGVVDGFALFFPELDDYR